MERIKWALYDLGALTLDMAYGIDSAFDKWFQRHEALGTALLMALVGLGMYAIAFFALL